MIRPMLILLLIDLVSSKDYNKRTSGVACKTLSGMGMGILLESEVQTECVVRASGNKDSCKC